jgi:hypothetical protein
MRVDPETAAGLLLRMAGLGSFFLAGAVITGSALVAVISLLGHRRPLARRAALVGGVFAGIYGLLLLTGPFLLGSRTLQPGQELAFCGFDCHLHLTVTGVDRRDGIDVKVRARSDAREAPEDPRYVALSLVDGTGTRDQPDAMTLDTPLGPGDMYERTLHFMVPPSAANLRLVGTWTGWPAYLVPGPDNIFAQRRNGILLTMGEDQPEPTP